ncbi:MAG: acyl carrier protein [Myxococcales bacterium]|nr:acyl carrier protein [Myxococcales bacterium]
MTDLDLGARVRSHVHDLGGPPVVTDDLDLFATGALESMQLLELINRLEDDFAIRIDERDVQTGRLRSVATIAALISERRGRA